MQPTDSPENPLQVNPETFGHASQSGMVWAWIQPGTTVVGSRCRGVLPL